MRSHANDEARRLRIQLDEDNAPIESFNEWLDFLVLEQARFGLDVRVTAGTVVDTRRTVATALRDATTEALTNVRKHSGTSLAFLTVQERSDGIVVIVQDFGTGFDTEARSGFGTVESIARRLAEVGGTSEIRSSPDEGTVVRLWVPA
jgi:signal transduction histidine kinase